MDSDKALSLQKFINTRSTRFDARVLAFGSDQDQAWVIVADTVAHNGTRRFLEPIADPDEYLRRAEAGVLEVDEEYRELILQWRP